MTNGFRKAGLTAALAVTVSASAATLPREMRVALVGDSLAYGAGDEMGKGIAGRLEPVLRRHGFETISTTNLAVNGATTRDLLTALRRPKTRESIEKANAIVLSVGANDLRPMLMGREPMRSPLVIADEVLQNLETIVGEIRDINSGARIFILGAYTPLANERAAVFLEPLVAMWDGALIAQFAGDPLISVVRLSDIVNRPERLSRLDSFHPGGEAYQEAAERIAGLLAGKMD